MLEETKAYYQDIYWLDEDKKRRLPLMKYPNGAFRGIVVIPEYPTNDYEQYEFSSLWINHVKSQVKIYRPTKEHQFLPKIYGVLSNATLMSEHECFRDRNPHFGDVQFSCGCCNSIPDGFNDGTLNTDYEKPYKAEHSVYEDNVYMG